MDTQNTPPTDDTTIAGVGDNMPPIDVRLDDRADKLIQSADAWLTSVEVIKTEDHMKAFKDVGDMAKALKKEVEKTRKDEKQPHLDAGTAVDKTFNAIKNKLTPVIDKLNVRMTAYLQEQERQRRAEVKAAEEKALAELQAAEDAKKKAEQDAQTNTGAPVESALQAEAASKQADDAVKTADQLSKSTVKVSGGYGRTTSLRTVWHAEITDYDKAFEHFKDHPKMRDLVETLANERARSADKIEVPGVEFKSEQKAA